MRARRNIDRIYLAKVRGIAAFERAAAKAYRRIGAQIVRDIREVWMSSLEK